MMSATMNEKRLREAAGRMRHETGAFVTYALMENLVGWPRKGEARVRDVSTAAPVHAKRERRTPALQESAV